MTMRGTNIFPQKNSKVIIQMSALNVNCACSERIVRVVLFWMSAVPPAPFCIS